MSDQPSTSGYIPHNISIEDEDDPESKLKSIWEEFVEKVSVAGWKEAFDEKIAWIRLIFKLALLTCLSFAIYYTYIVIDDYYQNEYMDEIHDTFDLAQLAAPNVTVCSQTSINETFIRQNITVPPKIIQELTRIKSNMDDFFSQFTRYLMKTTRIRQIDQRFVKYFDMLVQANPQMTNYSQYMVDMLPRCEHTLTNCQFNGVPFNCCHKVAHAIVADDGVCFVIALQYDSTSHHQPSDTLNQTNQSITGGLSFDAIGYPKQSPWAEDDAANGFLIYINPSPIVPYVSPVPASSHAETFIKVSVSERVWSEDCIDSGHLPKLMEGYYYDPYGYTCKADAGQNWVWKYLQCYTPFYHYRPNHTAVCGPSQVFALMTIISAFYDTLRSSYGTIDNGARMIEEDSKIAFRSDKTCPKQCRYYEYSTMVSFADLVKQENPFKNGTKEPLIFSRVHVYYTDFEFRQQLETKATTIYLSFCNFGNVIGLYLGMSIVSLAHVCFYVPYYLLVSRKVRKGLGGGLGNGDRIRMNVIPVTRTVIVVPKE